MIGPLDIGIIGTGAIGIYLALKSKWKKFQIALLFFIFFVLLKLIAT